MAASGVVAITEIYGILCLLKTESGSHCFAMQEDSEETGNSPDRVVTDSLRQYEDPCRIADDKVG